VLVKDRVLAFNEEFEHGRIETRLEKAEGPLFVVKAVVMPDTREPQRYFTGLSQAVVGQGEVNKTAALENAETSAVGRALAFMGIGVIESLASADEMTKAGVAKPAASFKAQPSPNPAADLEALNELGV
jgi:hypothetical protein